MKNLLAILLAIALPFLPTEHVSGQELINETPNKTVISLNDLKGNDRISLQEEILTITIRSSREEELVYRVLQGHEVLHQSSHQLAYGINEYQISTRELGQNIKKGDVFHLQFEAKHFGKGGFDVMLDYEPVLLHPAATIRVIPSQINCEADLPSSIEFLGEVHGGTAPYQVTWLVSKGSQIKDLISQPLKYELKNDQEASNLIVTEGLDYFVTLLVEDACGNEDKQVLYLKCQKDENQGMIYFQPIQLNNRTSKTRMQ